MQQGGEVFRGLDLKRWLVVGLPLGLVAALAFAAVAVASSGYPGDYPDKPPYEKPDYPGGDGPEGDHPESPPDYGDCGTPMPPGLEDEVHRVMEVVKDKLEDYRGPITPEVFKKYVREAALVVGVTDPAVLDFIIEKFEEHQPGHSCEGDEDMPGDGDDGVPDDGFHPGFMKRMWRVVVEIDDVRGRVLDVTVVRFVKLRKRFRHEDDEIIDAPALVLFNKRARLRDEKGKRISLAEFAKADRAVIKAKLLNTKRWREDEDGEITPTFRGRRGRVLGPKSRPGKGKGPGKSKKPGGDKPGGGGGDDDDHGDGGGGDGGGDGNSPRPGF